MTYSSLEQRLAQNYLDMLPSFVPDENAPVSVSEQEEFYGLIKGLFLLARDNPLLFVTALHDDDAFPNRFNKRGYGKPQLEANMKKFTKAVSGLLQAMFLLGQGEDICLSKKQLAVLSTLGVSNFAHLPAAWKWMSTKDGANISTFSHCLFDNNYPYTSEIYARLLGEPAFKKLEAWMLARGYKRFDIYEVAASHCNLSLSIVNPKWNSEPPRGGFEYKVKHTGISMRFDTYINKPPVLGLCIPGGMKPYLEAFNTMDTQLQAFVVDRTKKCDACNYCVQTDKTGLRPLAYTPVTFEGTEHLLCNYYPGYNYCWTSIDDGLADMLIKILSFMDRFVPAKAAKQA